MAPGTPTRYQHDARRDAHHLRQRRGGRERAVPSHRREARRGGHEGQPGVRVRPHRAAALPHPGQHADPAERQRVRRLGQRAWLLRVPRRRRAPLRRELPSRGGVLPSLPISVGRKARRRSRRGGRARALPSEVSVYASWNGATEVASWGILAGPAPDRLKTVGFVPRDGFETAAAARTDEPYVGVEAVDRRGRLLSRSATFVRRLGAASA
jgi:hypothetical protein